MSFDFTEEQLEVISARGPLLPVVATAGSGKTRCLTERYVKAVLGDNISPAEILAISFTRSSAAEMKSRIAERFLQLGRSDYAAEVDASPIQTFHSFAESLLRANSVALGLSPGFSILDEGLAKSWLNQAASDVLAEIYRKDSASLNRLKGWGHYVDVWHRNEFMEAHLKGLVVKLFWGLRTVDWFESQYADCRSILRLWLEQSSLEKGPADVPISSLRKLFEHGHRTLQDKEWTRLVEEVEILSFLVLTACKVQRRLETMMFAQQKLDFGLLERLAVDATVSNDTVRSFISSRFKMLMVDEAQDINVRQHRWVKAMPIPDKLLVGDPSQSIYRFRHAKPELFEQLIREERRLTISTNFRATERLVQVVNDLFPNGTGSFGTMRSQDSSGEEGRIEIWVVDGADAKLQLAEHFRRARRMGIEYGSMAIICDSWDEGKEYYRALDAAQVPVQILQQSETVHKRPEIRDVANALETFLYPQKKAPLLALLRSPYVGLSMDSILLLSQQADLLSALYSFDWPLEEDRQRAEKLLAWHEKCREVIPRLPAWEAISVLFSESGWLKIAATLPARDTILPNLQQLQTLACNNPDWDLATFISLSEQLKLERRIHTLAATHDDLQSSIQILTVHHSKGMEFDMVFVPMLEKTNERTDEWAYEEDSGMVIYTRNSTMAGLSADLTKAMKDEEKREAIRKEYVRLTRARKMLVFEARSKHVAEKSSGRFLRSILSSKSIGKSTQDPPYLVVHRSHDT